jgi:hypothetical protein
MITMDRPPRANGQRGAAGVTTARATVSTPGGRRTDSAVCQLRLLALRWCDPPFNREPHPCLVDNEHYPPNYRPIDRRQRVSASPLGPLRQAWPVEPVLSFIAAARRNLTPRFRAISSGLCCRPLPCVDCLHRLPGYLRRAVKVLHSLTSHNPGGGRVTRESRRARLGCQARNGLLSLVTICHFREPPTPASPLWRSLGAISALPLFMAHGIPDAPHAPQRPCRDHHARRPRADLQPDRRPGDPVGTIRGVGGTTTSPDS